MEEEKGKEGGSMSAMPQAGQQLQLEKVLGSGARQGAAVEVMTPENRLLFVGKIDTIQSGAVCVRDTNDDMLPMVLINKELKLRFFTEQGSVVLHGKVCGSTMRMWKVDRLQSAFTKEHRAFFRQSISVAVAAQCGKRTTRGGRPNVMFPCQVLDISAGGMLLSCGEVYAEGNYLLVTDVGLLADEPPFSFNCVVRRSGEWKKGVTRYGCQFVALSPKDQDSLLRAIFTIQREEIRKRKVF